MRFTITLSHAHLFSYCFCRFKKKITRFICTSDQPLKRKRQQHKKNQIIIIILRAPFPVQYHLSLSNKCGAHTILCCCSRRLNDTTGELKKISFTLSHILHTNIHTQRHISNINFCLKRIVCVCVLLVSCLCGGTQATCTQYIHVIRVTAYGSDLLVLCATFVCVRTLYTHIVICSLLLKFYTCSGLPVSLWCALVSLSFYLSFFSFSCVSYRIMLYAMHIVKNLSPTKNPIFLEAFSRRNE